MSVHGVLKGGMGGPMGLDSRQDRVRDSLRSYSRHG
jgi:hypothetical protein